MAYQQSYYSGQGKLILYTKDATTGLPSGGGLWLGNVPKMTVNMTVQAKDHNESFTGQSLTDARFETQTSGKLMLTLEEFNKENLEFAFYGTSLSTTGATVTNEAVTSRLGKSVSLNNINITAFTSLVIPGGSPTTLVTPGDYTINLDTGLITFADTPTTVGLTDGLTLQANYTFGTYSRTFTYSKANASYWLQFHGLNRVYSQGGRYQPVLINVPSVRFTPPQSRDYIGEDYSKMDIEGLIMYEQRATVLATSNQYYIAGGFFGERTTVRA